MLKSIDPTTTSAWKSLQASYQKHHAKEKKITFIIFYFNLI
jgi:hypothetical protein